MCEEARRTEGPPHGEFALRGGFFAAQGFPLCERFLPRRDFRSTGIPAVAGDSARAGLLGSNRGPQRRPETRGGERACFSFLIISFPPRSVKTCFLRTDGI